MTRLVVLNIARLPQPRGPRTPFAPSLIIEHSALVDMAGNGPELQTAGSCLCTSLGPNGVPADGSVSTYAAAPSAKAAAGRGRAHGRPAPISGSGRPAAREVAVAVEGPEASCAGARARRLLLGHGARASEPAPATATGSTAARRCADPASRFQPEGPARPLDGRRSRPLSPGATRAGRGVPRRGQVLYELHVGTFTREGTWRAAAERLPTPGRDRDHRGRDDAGERVPGTLRLGL